MQSTVWADPIFGSDTRGITTTAAGPITGGGGGPAIRTTFDTSGPNQFLGGRGGLILWDRLLIGGGGYIGVPAGAKDTGASGYGGVMVEIFATKDKPVTVSFGTLLGAGGIEGEGGAEEGESDGFLVGDFALNLNIRMNKVLVITPNLRYVHTWPIGSDGSRSTGMNGFGAGVDLRFGAF